MKKRILDALCVAAIAAPAFIPASAVAQGTMSADEIFRRLEIQAQDLPAQQGTAGRTRGLRLNYGDDAETPPPAAIQAPSAAVESTSSVTVFETVEPTAAIPSFGAAPAETAPSVETVTLPRQSDDPVALFYPEATTVAQPTYIDVTPQAVSAPAPQTVAVEQYRAVQDAGRIDLRIYFEWNSAALRPEAIGQLSELCSAVRRMAGSRVFKIIGHTDKSGSDSYNLYLSEARAREVKRHLIEECAIPASALLAVGEGERQSNPNSPERAPDERLVEFQLVG